MPSASQRHAVRAYRSRQRARGLARFEVVAPRADKPLLSGVARQLVEGGALADRTRRALVRAIGGPQAQPGGVWRMLRASPLVGIDFDDVRDATRGRVVDL